MATWQETVWRIRNVKMELAKLDPRLGPAISPHLGAEPRAITAVERKLKRRLPPSYRAFLDAHDGWPLFFQGASLLGTRELGRDSYAELTRATFESYQTPIPEIGPPARPEGRSEAMIPFGIDPSASIVFAFNPAVVRPDGEMEVIVWINELGERREGFADFLTMVLEMLEADLADRGARFAKTA